MSDSSYTSILTSCTSIILTYSHYNLEKKIKIAFIDDNQDFFFTLRVAQTTIQLKINTLWIVQPAIIFSAPLTLRVIQPAI